MVTPRCRQERYAGQKHVSSQKQKGGSFRTAGSDWRTKPISAVCRQHPERLVFFTNNVFFFKICHGFVVQLHKRYRTVVRSPLQLMRSGSRSRSRWPFHCPADSSKRVVHFGRLSSKVLRKDRVYKAVSQGGGSGNFINNIRIMLDLQRPFGAFWR